MGRIARRSRSPFERPRARKGGGVLRSALSDASGVRNPAANYSPLIRFGCSVKGGTVNRPLPCVTHRKQSSGHEQGRNVASHLDERICRIENGGSDPRSVSVAPFRPASQPCDVPQFHGPSRLLLTKTANRPYNGGSSIQLEAACTP